MKTIKRLSTILFALVVFVSASYQPIHAATKNTVSNGTYMLPISLMNASNINNPSMCNALFYPEMIAEVTGDTTTITLYVLDPIPTFSSAGQPITELKLTYSADSSKEYIASIDTTNQVTKTFNTAFMGDIIGDYPCDVITASIPTQAMLDSSNGVLNVTAFVNAVMNTYVDFFLVVDTSNLSASATETTTQTTQIVAEVIDDTPDYYVTIPSTISLGTLSKIDDTTVDYEIKVETKNLASSSYLQISAPETGTLQSGSNTIAFNNTLGVRTYTSSTVDTAQLSVKAQNVETAGSYTGTTTFEIMFFE